MRKIYYCPKCNGYPDMVVEENLEPQITKKEWNGEYYGTIYSNVMILKTHIICGVCGTKIEER